MIESWQKTVMTVVDEGLFVDLCEYKKLTTSVLWYFSMLSISTECSSLCDGRIFLSNICKSHATSLLPVSFFDKTHIISMQRGYGLFNPFGSLPYKSASLLIIEISSCFRAPRTCSYLGQSSTFCGSYCRQFTFFLKCVAYFSFSACVSSFISYERVTDLTRNSSKNRAAI